MITEEQRLARRNGLGGSDIAGIVPCDPEHQTKTGTLSPWATQVQIWDSKVGPDTGDRIVNKEAAWWGSEEEDLVAKRFTMLTGKRTVNHNFMITDGCLIANLDRLIIPAGQKIAAHHGVIRTNELFEAKTAGEEWPMTDVVTVTDSGFEILDGSGIPAHYVTQCNHYLGRVPSAERIFVGVKMAIPCGRFARTEFRAYVLERDDEAITSQDNYARWWWEEFVVGGKRPEAVCEEDVQILWRRSKPMTKMTVTKTMFDAWKRLRLAKDTLKLAKEEEEKAKIAIQAEMKDSESIVGPDGVTVLATWKTGKDKTKITTDWEKLARDKGVTDEEIAAATTTVTSPGSRSFLPKFTDKIVSVAEQIDISALPEPEQAKSENDGQPETDEQASAESAE